MMDYDERGTTQMGEEWLTKATAYHPVVGPHKAQAGDVRICFSIAYFTDPEVAKEAGEYSKMHNRYNGGMFHGSSCGRDPGFDFKWKGVTYYAVTY